LVLSPTGSINLGFTTEGRLVAVLIITFSWGFQLSGHLQYSYINTAPPGPSVEVARNALEKLSDTEPW
jgi:hypothetical protein